MKQIYVTVFFLFFCFWLNGQIISGSVVNEQGEQLIGASVFNKKLNIGAIVDVDGEFELKVNLGDTLAVKYIGYQDQEIIVINREFITIRMAINQGSIITDCFVLIKGKYTNNHAYVSIPKEIIQLRNVQAPQDLYNDVPGLFMHAGALNTNRLTIRGIGSRSPFSTTKIKAYLNDIPLTNGIGESNIEDLNLAMVDQVEILKGPTEPIFGAGLGGVIHYRTRRSERDESSLKAEVGYGSFNTINSNINYNYNTPEAIFSLNHDLLKSEGYRDNNNYQRQSISGFAQVDFNKDALTVFVNLTKVEAQIPSGLNIEDFKATPEAAAFNWKSAEGYEDYDRNQVAISHQRDIGELWKTNVTGFMNTFQNYERRPFNVLTQNAISVGSRVRVTRETKNGQGEFQFGGEFFTENEDWSTYETLDQGRGNILSDNFEIRNYLNLFVQEQFTISQFTFDLGANFNQTVYKYDDRYLADNINQSGTFDFKPQISPFINIGYRKNNLKTYYLSLSHGFSSPTLEETLTPEGQLNPNIKAETGWNAEIGTRQNINGLELDFSAYYMWVENLLVAERVNEDQFIGINAGKTLHPGIELSGEKIVSSGIKKLKDLKINFSYQYSPHKFKEFLNRDNDFSNNFLPGNPNHKANLDLVLRNKKLDVGVSNQFVGPMFADDANAISVDHYFLLNTSVQYRIIDSNSWKLKVNAFVNNVLNKQYASMISVNPRSFGSNLPRYLYGGLPRNYNFSISLCNLFNN